MIHVTEFPPGSPARERDVADLAELRKGEGCFWVEMDAPTDAEFARVQESFEWHPLAIEDLRVDNHLPKIDDYGDHLLLVVHAVALDERDRFDTAEIEIFLGANYLITHHREPAPVIDALLERSRRNGLLASRGPAYLLYLLLDSMADVYLPFLESLDEKIDAIEEEILDQPAKDTLGKIYSMKRDVITIRRIVLPQAEVLRRLGRDEFPILPEDSAMYFRDVHDHLYRVSEEANSFRDLLTGALDSYLSSVSNNMNQVMKVLTVFASIFIPLTFLAGIWGMNFDSQPELHMRHAYPLALGLMLVIGVAIVAFFKRKRWL